MQRKVIAIFCGFIVQLAGLLLIHSVWLKADYIATAAMWRSQSAQNARIWAMLVAILFYVAGAVLLYRPGPREQSWVVRGLCFGALLAMIAVVYGSLSGWVILPIPHALALKWIAGEGLLSLAFGMLVAGLLRGSDSV